MGYALGIGNCFICGERFGFNPNKVPSIRIEGVREPVCRNCMVRANKKRVKLGMVPLPIQEDAFKPIKEEELRYD